MIYRPLLLLALAAFAPISNAQTLCADLDTLIDASIMTSAMSQAQGSLDKSAAQQTARYLAINNELQLISINLAIQSQNKCPIRKNGINPFRYQLQAMDCLLARMKNEDVPSKCNFRAWKPE